MSKRKVSALARTQTPTEVTASAEVYSSEATMGFPYLRVAVDGPRPAQLDIPLCSVRDILADLATQDGEVLAALAHAVSAATQEHAREAMLKRRGGG